MIKIIVNKDNDKIKKNAINEHSTGYHFTFWLFRAHMYKQPLILNVASYSCDMLRDFSCLF